MLVIEAIAVRGQPLPEPLRATFDEAGGTIGRAGASTLALPDPERRISRTHATIGFDSRGFVLTDTGSFNRLVLNGRSLSGGHAYLKDGDKLTVGSYRLLVHLSGAASALAHRQSPPTPMEDEPGADPKAALSTPASSTELVDAPADGSPGASLPAGIAPDQPAPATQIGATEKNPRAAAQDQLPPKPARDLDPIFKSRDARIEPYLPNELIVPRPALPEADVLGLYPFFPLDSGPERTPEIDGEPPAALPRGEPPVLTSVWDPDDDEQDVASAPDASEATVYAGTPIPGAVAASAHGLTVQQLTAILRGAGVSGITPESLELIGRVLRESVQGNADAPPARLEGGAQSRSAKRRGQGFTTPIHHSGILVSMRGALSDIAGRMSPHRLETWLKRKSPLHSLLPTNH
jgi:predicted component of type VI protein secretion system